MPNSKHNNSFNESKRNIDNILNNCIVNGSKKNLIINYFKSKFYNEIISDQENIYFDNDNLEKNVEEYLKNLDNFNLDLNKLKNNDLVDNYYFSMNLNLIADLRLKNNESFSEEIYRSFAEYIKNLEINFTTLPWDNLKEIKKNQELNGIYGIKMQKVTTEFINNYKKKQNHLSYDAKKYIVWYLKNKNIVEVNINDDDSVNYFKLINLIYVHNMMNIKNIIMNKSIIKKNNNIDGTLSDNINLNHIVENNNENNNKNNNENNNKNYIKDEYFEERVLEIIKKYDESKEDKVTILEYILYQFFKFITIFSLVLYISKCFSQKENKEENEYNNFMFWKK